MGKLWKTLKSVSKHMSVDFSNALRIFLLLQSKGFQGAIQFRGDVCNGQESFKIIKKQEFVSNERRKGFQRIQFR